MSVKTAWSQSVGPTLTDWATYIFPSHVFVTKSTAYLRALRLRMLRVISRIDNELKRRET